MRRQLRWAVVLLIAACGPGVSPEGVPVADDPPSQDFDFSRQPGIKGRISLTSFAGASACAELEQHIEDRAVLQMRVQVAASKKDGLQTWAWYQQHGTPYAGDPGWAMDAGMAGGMGGAGGAGGSPSAYTTTNTQVKGVDEPDFVKNDGNRIFVLSGRTLYATSSWPASALSRQGALQIDGTPREMFLEGNRLVVFSEFFDGASGNLPSWCTDGYCSSWYHNATKVTFVDASDLSAMRITQTHVVPGKYRTARRIGPVVRLVVTAVMGLPGSVRTYVGWEESRAALTAYELAARYDILAWENEQLIRQQTLGQWIPSIRSLAAGSTSLEPLDCAAVASPDTSGMLGLSSVVTLNLDLPDRVARTSLLVRSDEVYASPSALYLAQQHWWWLTTARQPSATYLHKLDLSSSDSVAWVGSGKVDGTLVDQFSLDEHQGYLRAATTLEGPLASDGRSFRTLNRISVLSEHQGALVKVGQSADLAVGERIMSARFLGDKGYVVTFRQVDPLFTFDLSDPIRPTQIGELKVPGFSSYIHPLDDTHLLTIGTYVPEQTSNWSERALQLAIFDVTDLAHPRQTFVQKVGNVYGWSEAQGDHKAFNYFPEKKLLAIPFFDWSYGDGWSSYVSSLKVFRVDAQAGFASLGSLDMRDVLSRPESDLYACWSWWWQPMVRRSVMADDFVYAISSGGIRVANVADLNQPVATVAFDYAAP